MTEEPLTNVTLRMYRHRGLIVNAMHPLDLRALVFVVYSIGKSHDVVGENNHAAGLTGRYDGRTDLK